jgi:hypothetical protein
MTKELPQPEKNKELPAGLSSSVLEKINERNVRVVPRWRFAVIEYGTWFFWICSVLIGAISFAMILFFLTHAGFAFYEATHDTPLDLLMDILPVLWISVFALMAIWAHVNLRHTKRGYRYPVWQVLTSSIIFSFLGGLVLHIIGIGFLVDHFVAERLPMFPALERIEGQIWQNPGEGRMVGMFVSEGTNADTNSIVFEDIEGTEWHIYTDELAPPDLLVLKSGETVRMIGIVSSSTGNMFYGCNVFPSSFDRSSSIRGHQSARNAFIQKMNTHRNPMPPLSMDTKQDMVGISEEAIMMKNVCARQPAIRRIELRNN